MGLINWLIERLGTYEIKIPEYKFILPTDKIDMTLYIPEGFREAKVLRPVFENIAKEYEKAGNEAIQRYCDYIKNWEDTLLNGSGEDEPVGLFNSDSSEGVKDVR